MALIDVQRLSKSFGGDLVFSDLSFRLLNGQKVAIIGPNGAGKSTLLKIIMGEELPDEGIVHRMNGISIGYLTQTAISHLDYTVIQEMETVFEDVHRLEREMHDLGVLMQQNPHDNSLLKRYGDIEHRFEEMGGYTYHHRISEVLDGFGLSIDDCDRVISSFSGGERTKIAFAKLLLKKPDVLILDEPTNHLDIATISWLENYLIDYGSALLFVSHDRYFIDMIATHILELDYHVGEWYVGNYTSYLDEKALRYEQRLLHYKMQQAEMEKLRLLVEKFKPKPTKVRFAKDREKKLAKMKLSAIADPRRSHADMKLRIQHEGFAHRAQFTLNDFTVGYDYPFFQPFTRTIYSGDKIAVMGANGTGKSTLIKAIIGKVTPFSGTKNDHRSLSIGFFDQHQIDVSGEQSMADYLHDLYPLLTNFEVRKQLGLFLFTQEDAFKPLSVLSGGEKMRLAFAILFMKHYDVLILDEPTNHLDLTTKKVLENALDDYQGTVIMVSHDRYFVDEVASEIWYIDNQKLTLFEGNYSSYQLSLTDRPIAIVTAKEKTVEKAKEPEKKSISLPPLATIEKTLNELCDERDSLKADLDHPDAEYDYVEIRAIESQIEQLEMRIEEQEQLYLARLEWDQSKQ